MKKLLLTIGCWLLAAGYFTFAQSFSPTVLASAGTFASSASGSMAWTIGEVTTETYASAGNFFTQGFHQPEGGPVSVSEISSSQNISVYPNPVSYNLTVDFANADGVYSLYVYDMLGNLVSKNLFSTPPLPSGGVGGGLQFTIPFRDYANGIYLLNITNVESGTSSAFRIHKTE